jgi:hypothetical protein
MLFDLLLQLQNARLQEQSSTKQSNLIRRLRDSLIRRQTTTAKPVTSEVSENLALSFLLTSEDDGPF